MTASVLDAPPARARKGVQEPRIHTVPSYVQTSGHEAVQLAASAGLILDPWQQLVLVESLGEKADGKWAAFEVGLIVSRQNGKGAILEARELAGLFLLGERLILHSAHEFKTASEAFRRVLQLVESTPDLSREVTKVRTSHGDEGIELKTGQRLRFVARSTGSGRGFTGDCIVLDEAYNLGPPAMAALLPTLSARPNPQLWYTSSAGMVDSIQLSAVRERALRGGSAGLAYFEWSAPEDADLDDRHAWAQANPAIGYRITDDFIALERDAMPAMEFARERLGVWDDPSRVSVIPTLLWNSLVDDKWPRPVGKVAFAVDVSPDRSFASIAVAGQRADELLQVQVIDRRPGTDWVAARVAELTATHDPCAVVLDRVGAAASLRVDLEETDVPLVLTTTTELVEACGQFYDACMQRKLRHLDQRELNAAIAGAEKRQLEAAWAWRRKDATVDLTPLVSSTLALWGWTTRHASGDILQAVW